MFCHCFLNITRQETVDEEARTSCNVKNRKLPRYPRQQPPQCIIQKKGSSFKTRQMIRKNYNNVRFSQIFGWNVTTHMVYNYEFLYCKYTLLTSSCLTDIFFPVSSDRLFECPLKRVAFVLKAVPFEFSSFFSFTA